MDDPAAKRRARHQRYRDNHRDQVRLADRVRHARFRAKHREEMREGNRAKSARFRANHPEKMRVAYAEGNRRKYAQKHGAQGSHTIQEWTARLASNGGRCIWCESQERVGRDHLIPLSRGGTDYIDNVYPACRSCNSSKSDKLVEEWFGLV